MKYTNVENAFFLDGNLFFLSCMLLSLYVDDMVIDSDIDRVVVLK